jgi:hypothetical protein
MHHVTLYTEVSTIQLAQFSSNITTVTETMDQGFINYVQMNCCTLLRQSLLAKIKLHLPP